MFPLPQQVMRALQLPPEAWLRLRGDNTNITERLGFDHGMMGFDVKPL